MQEQLNALAFERARNDAIRQLSYRQLSGSMLRQKLEGKGHSAQSIEQALAWLVQNKLLCDAHFAQSIVQSYARRGYGLARIRQELYKRGIEKEEAEQALCDCYEPEQDTLLALLHQKLRGRTSDPKEVQKAIAFLQRRGFSWDEIRPALRTLKAEIDEVDV